MFLSINIFTENEKINYLKAQTLKKETPVWFEHPLNREQLSTNLRLPRWATLTYYNDGEWCDNY